MEKEVVKKRFKGWQSLLDVSMYFALAGMKLKGYSEREGLNCLRDCWIRASQEHDLSNLKIMSKLYGHRNKRK